ncbi:MAG: hypothetical protein R2874_15615 [Desulfobacterales bacterium]
MGCGFHALRDFYNAACINRFLLCTRKRKTVPVGLSSGGLFSQIFPPMPATALRQMAETQPGAAGLAASFLSHPVKPLENSFLVA